MASHLFSSNSSSDSDHNAFNYRTPVKRKVCRKLFREEDRIHISDDDDEQKNDNNYFHGYDGSKSIHIDDEFNEDFVDKYFGRCVDDDYVDDKYVENDGDGKNEEEKFEFDNKNEEEKIEFDNNDVVPCIGMEFNSLDEAENFYRDYGRRVGFEIIIRTTRRNSTDGPILTRLFICRKGGRLGLNPDCEDEGTEKRPRDVIPRSNCHARMSVKLNKKTNKWMTTIVDLKHNHDMVTPDMAQFMQRSRNIGPITRELIELFHKSGIHTPQIMNLLGETCGGGLENLGFSSQDTRNVIRDIRRRVFDGGDAECGMVLLRDLQEINGGNFFYRVNLDEENRVKGLVWVDPRSMHAYKNFGDVVTFDSTYRTNRYCMPFIPITGVNHHYQNILFGFALIRDEKETSYTWVLKTWLEAVENKFPITIITDQDKALGNAIAKVMPNVNHVFCSWHISCKFPEKLSSLYTTYPDFKSDFNACLYKSLSPTQFEGMWEFLVEKYNLEDHVWLNEMYALRKQWIRAYTRQNFAAGMTTTSRSESMNSFFDEYVKASTGLKEFIENSQKALERQYLVEAQSDHDTVYKARKLLYNSPLEYHASSIYTKEMFRRFQKELLKSHGHVIKDINEGEFYFHTMYFVEKVTNTRDFGRGSTLRVAFDGMASCDCRKFEHSGIICCHIICYLSRQQFTSIPEYYIRFRWTTDGNKIAGPLPYTTPAISKVEESQPARYSSLCKAFQSLSVLGSCSVPRYKHLMNVIEEQKIYLENSFPEEKSNRKKNQAYDHDDGFEQILDPPMSTTKGRKKTERYKSGVETSASKRKPRKCRKCGEEGAKHDRRNCNK